MASSSRALLVVSGCLLLAGCGKGGDGNADAEGTTSTGDTAGDGGIGPQMDVTWTTPLASR